MSNVENETIRFRSFRDGDLPELERMIFALYDEDPCEEPISIAKVRETARELSSYPEKGTIVIFEAKRSVVGYAIVVFRWSNEYGGDIALIDEFFVEPAWRSRGIGSSFLERVAAMRAGGVRGIQLEVHPGNERALAFYRARGFSPAANRWLFRKAGMR